jgi:hypothetical protein
MAEDLTQERSHEGVPIKRYAAVLFRYKYLIGITFATGTILGIVGAILFVRDMSVFDGTKLVLVQSPQSQLRNLLDEDPRRVQDDPFLLDATLAQLMEEGTLRQVVMACKLDEQEKAFAAEAEQSAGGRFSAWIGRRLSFILDAGGAEPTFSDIAVRTLKRNLSLTYAGPRTSRPATGSTFPGRSRTSTRTATRSSR